MSESSPSLSPAPAMFSSRNPRPGSRLWLALAVACLCVLAVAGLWVALSGSRRASSGGRAYASRLTVKGITMSTAGNLGGGQETYLDGTVTNTGARTVLGATVNVVFHNFSNGVAATVTLPITLVRFQKPYVDVEPVSMAPIGPGESRQFRVAFDSVPDSWNQSYPDVRFMDVRLK